MKDKFYKQAGREHSETQRIWFMVFLGPIFLLLLPLGLVVLGMKIDEGLQISPFPSEPFNLILGCLLVALGISFALWSIYIQFTIGRGTPVPLMATQKLIIQPPYSYCRNPMALGTFVAYAGVGVLFRSLGALLMVLVFAVLLSIYIKRGEEKEMEARFGQEYLEYRKDTPFLIPRLWKRR